MLQTNKSAVLKEMRSACDTNEDTGIALAVIVCNSEMTGKSRDFMDEAHQ